jgi:archaellum biogenesis ATPase FlaH
VFDPFLGNKEGGATRRVASESNSAQNIGAPFAHLINEVETLSTSPKINPTLQRLDVSRMLKEPPPPVPWIVDGIVARGYLTVIHGDGGIGKSFLALQLCVAAMSGGRFLDRDTKRCRVLYVDAENGEGEAHRRLHLLGAEDGIAEFFEYVVADGHDLIKNSDELEDMVARCHPDLIVVDSLASLWSIKENDSTEMTRAMMVLTRIAARYEAGVIALHHDKKDGTSYRGSGAANAACQVRFQLLRHSTDDTEDATKLVLQRKKNRMGPQDLRIYLQIINSADRLEVTVVSKHVSALQDSLGQQILELVSDGVVRNNREIAEALGRRATDGSVGRAVKALKASGVLVSTKGGVKIANVASDPAIRPLGAGALDQDTRPASKPVEELPDENAERHEDEHGSDDEIIWEDDEESA